MYNKIFFSLLVTIALSMQGMEQDNSEQKKTKKKNIFSRAIQSVRLSYKPKKKSPQITQVKTHPLLEHDILIHITEQIGIENNWELQATLIDIKQFSHTNKTLYLYYSTDENIRKNITRTIALLHNKSDRYVAHYFGYEKIRDRITHLFDIAENSAKQFTKNDLEDTWYLNATRSKSEGNYTVQQTLLLVTVQKLYEEKTKALINAGADYHCRRYQNLLAYMTGKCIEFNDYRILCTENQKNFYFIVHLLLQKKIAPDSRYKITSPTLLHRAAHNNDQCFARLLLQYGANPYKLFLDFVTQGDNHPKFIKKPERQAQACSIDTLYMEMNNSAEPWKHNAFTLEKGELKGWLKTMYDEIQSKQLK